MPWNQNLTMFAGEAARQVQETVRDYIYRPRMEPDPWPASQPPLPFMFRRIELYEAIAAGGSGYARELSWSGSAYVAGGEQFLVHNPTGRGFPAGARLWAIAPHDIPGGRWEILLGGDGVGAPTREFELDADVTPELIYSGVADCTKYTAHWMDNAEAGFVYFEDSGGQPICFGVGWSSSYYATGTRGTAVQRADGLWIVTGGQFETVLPARKLAGGSGSGGIFIGDPADFTLLRVSAGALVDSGHHVTAINWAWETQALGMPPGETDPAWVNYNAGQRQWYCVNCNPT